jgi:hypothetical protein
MTVEAAQEDAPVFHPAGTAYPYACVEVHGAFVGAYEDADGTLVVEVHPAPSDGAPAIAIRVDDSPVLEEPGLSRGRHARKCVHAP